MTLFERFASALGLSATPQPYPPAPGGAPRRNGASSAASAVFARPEHLAQINACFLEFGENPLENISRLVNLCGELVQADCVLYNRLDGEELITSAAWQAPPGYVPRDKAEGHICFDVIRTANTALDEDGRIPEGVVAIRNLPDTPYYHTDPNVRQYDLHTYIGRPVCSGERAVGSLCAVFQRDYVLTAQDEALLGILARAVGVESRRLTAILALEDQVTSRTLQLKESNYRLGEVMSKEKQSADALRRLGDQLQWLVRTAGFLASSLDLNEVLTRVGEGARQILKGDASTIYLLEADGKTLTPVMAFDEPYADEVLSTPLIVDNSLTGRAVLERKALIINDASHADGAAHIPGTPVELEEHLIAAPFVAADAVLGVMTHNRVGAPFTEADLTLARTFADYAAIALHNARLYEVMHTVLRAHQSSEARYRELVENIGDLIIVFNPSGTIFDINQAACDTLGYTRDELLVLSVGDLIPADANATLERFEAELQARNQVQFEVEILTRLGERLPMEISARRVLDDERELIFSVARDISERKERERSQLALLQVSQALRSAAVRADMFPILTREVRTILNACCAQIYQTNEPAGLALAAEDGKMISAMGVQDNWVESDLRLVIARKLPIDRIVPEAQDGEPTRVITIMPLMAEQRAFGALLVGRHTPFTRTDRRVLEAIIDVAANALHRAELHERTQFQNQRLTALQSIERAITSILHLDTLLKVVIQHIVELLNVDAADILLYESPTLGLNYAYGQGFRAFAPNPTALRETAGLARQAVLEQRLVYRPDITQLSSGSPALVEWLHDEAFVTYIGVPLIVRGNVVGVLELFHRQRLSPDKPWRDFLDTLAGQLATAIDNISLLDDLQRTNMELTLAYDKTLEGWAKALELKDKETEGHSRRVTSWTMRLAREMGIPDDQLVHVRRGTLLHDIGKMGIPDNILTKPGPLTSDQWEIMRMHPTYAYDLLSPIPYLRPALEIPYCHHERWDGSGYPRGLRGEQIPLAARIFAVVDVWDALLDNRAYRPSWPHDQVKAYLRQHAGTLFDPVVVATFLRLLDAEDAVSRPAPAASARGTAPLTPPR